MEDLLQDGARSVHFDGQSGRVSLGNPEKLQIEGVVTIEACIWNGGDPRPGQMQKPYRCIVAHGHDGTTEVNACDVFLFPLCSQTVFLLEIGHHFLYPASILGFSITTP
jgi:hypothetical protein